MEARELRQKYLSYLILGQNLVYEIMNNYPEMMNDENIMLELSLLNEYLMGSNVSNQTIEQLGSQIQKVQGLVYKKDSGSKKGYQKVKSNGAYVEAEEVKKPDYTFDFIQNDPIYSKPKKGVEFPYYVASNGDKISPIANNRGHSNIFMLSFLTFFFEALFVLLSLVLYQ